METENVSLTALAWEVLFGEKYETVPDPNKPENVSYYNAKKRERNEKLRLFCTGQGKVIYDEWKKKIRAETLALLTIPKTSLCNCMTCLILREIRPRLELILEAEDILKREGDVTKY